MQEEHTVNNQETIEQLLQKGKQFDDLLNVKAEEAQDSLEHIEQLAKKIKEIKNNATLQNVDTFNADIVGIRKEIDNFKQNFSNNFINQSTTTDSEKSFSTINAELNKWKTQILDKIGTKLDDLWDSNNEKFKQETRWWINFFSSKPTQSELEEQRNQLLSQSVLADGTGVKSVTKINSICDIIKNKQVEIETSLTALEQFYKNKKQQEEEKKRQEEEKKRQEEEKKKQAEENSKANITSQQGNERWPINSRRKNIDTIEHQEIDKIAEWLQNEQNATRITEEDIIDQCREFGVDNCDDFKSAFLQDIELEKMQEFIQNEQNVPLEKEKCAKLFERYGITTFEEFREKLNQGAQEIAETIDGNGADKIRDKLHNKAQHISDYVDYMNNLASNQGKPLIQKANINVLQAKANQLKQKLGEQNIFIKFLMLFGYDPDGLVTAYHIAKNRLKEAQWDERNNMLTTSSNNNITNNNAMYSKPYFGNGMLVNNNNTAQFGQQSIQQSNTGLGY